MEMIFYFKVVQFFVFRLVFKLSQENHFYNIDGSSKVFGNTGIIEKKRMNSKTNSNKNLTTKLIGKNFFVTGVVVQISKRKQLIKSMLMECSKCRSIFFCIFESFLVDTPFLCIKTNCGSKIFHSFTERSLTVFWQKLKIQGDIEFKKLRTFSRSFDVELLGKTGPGFNLGDLVFCRGILKILRFKKGTEKTGFLRNIFCFYIQSQQIFFSPPRNRLKKNFFLTKKEYIFINKLYSRPDLFSLLLKTMESISPGDLSWKAGILLMASQVGCHFEKITRDSIRSLILIEGNSNRKSFIETARIFPKSFFLETKTLNPNHTRTYFDKKKTNLDLCSNIFFWHGKRIIFIEDVDHGYQLLSYEKTLNGKRLFSKIPTNVQSSIIICFKQISKFLEPSLKFISNSEINIKNFPGFDLIYLVSDKGSKLSDYKNCEKLLNYFNPKFHHFLSGLNRKEREREKFSRYFFRRFFIFAQYTHSPIFNEDASVLAVEFYKNLCFFFKKTKQREKIGKLGVILKLAQSRTKMDLRERTTKEDILDVIEIVSDSKNFLKDNWEKIAFEKGLTGNNDLSVIRKIIKRLRKSFAMKGQTVFDLKTFQPNSGQNFHNFKLTEAVEILKRCNLIKKTGKRVFKICKTLSRLL